VAPGGDEPGAVGLLRAQQERDPRRYAGSSVANRPAWCSATSAEPVAYASLASLSVWAQPPSLRWAASRSLAAASSSAGDASAYFRPRAGRRVLGVDGVARGQPGAGPAGPIVHGAGPALGAVIPQRRSASAVVVKGLASIGGRREVSVQWSRSGSDFSRYSVTAAVTWSAGLPAASSVHNA